MPISLQMANCGLAAILVLFVGSRLPAALGDDAIEPAAAIAQRTLRGLRDERLQLRSGHVSISGESFARSSGKVRERNAVQSEYAFDLSAQSYRYCNRESFRIQQLAASSTPGTNGISSTAQKPPAFPCRLLYVQNSDTSAWWTQDSQTLLTDIELGPREGLVPSSVISRHHYYDLRAVGVQDYAAFRGAGSLSTIFAELLDGTFVSAQVDGSRTTLSIKTTAGRTELIVETRDGFQPVQRVTTDPSGDIEVTSQTTWTRKAGVFVPATMTMTRRVPKLDLETGYELTYDWHAVNTPLNSRLFTWESFPDLPTTLSIDVVDKRGKAPVRIGLWNGSRFVVPHPESP